MPRDKVRDAAFPVGVFILVAIVIFTGTMLWMRDFTLRPHYSFRVQYGNPGRLSTGIAVLYRGVAVGRVTQIDLAPDLNSTYVTVGITRRAFPISKASVFRLRTEGITGHRYLDIVPSPYHDSLAYHITQGEIVRGEDPANWDGLQKQLQRIGDEGGLESLVASGVHAMDSVSQTSQQWGQFSAEARQFLGQTRQPVTVALMQVARSGQHLEGAATDIQQLARQGNHHVNTLIPQVSLTVEQLNHKVTEAGDTLVGINRAAKQVERAFNTLNKQLTETQTTPSLSENGSLESTSDANALQATGTMHAHSPKTGNTLITEQPTVVGNALRPVTAQQSITVMDSVKDTLSQTQQAMSRVDCVTRQIHQMLDERFLGLKLLFGRPGGSVSCESPPVVAYPPLPAK